MTTVSPTLQSRHLPQLQARDVVQLLKPVTWFPPMWAFGCGVVSSGVPVAGRWAQVLTGIVLAGPLVCAMSQAVNDWFDRHVDAINEPDRPIPSGRIPGRWGLWIACAWTVLSLAVGSTLGRWAFGATCVAVALAWAYSAPPLRLKANGWFGNAACGFSYETLAWVTGAAVMTGADAPSAPILWLAGLYGLGAHGIMTLNDFKAIEGDRQMGVRSLPVQLGAARAGRLASAVIVAPQLAVIALLMAWGKPVAASIVVLLVSVQVAMQLHFVEKPVERALWYSAGGVPFSVLGMMIAAMALRGVLG